jgi:hypothetical protein
LQFCNLACGTSHGTPAGFRTLQVDENRRLGFPQIIRKLPTMEAVEKGSHGGLLLAKRLHEIVDKRVEISVSLTEILDLSNGVNHRRMVLAPEAPPDFRE